MYYSSRTIIHLHNSYPKKKWPKHFFVALRCNIPTQTAEVAIGSAFRYGILVHQGCSILTTGYRSLHGHFGPTKKPRGNENTGKGWKSVVKVVNGLKHSSRMWVLKWVKWIFHSYGPN